MNESSRPRLRLPSSRKPSLRQPPPPSQSDTGARMVPTEALRLVEPEGRHRHEPGERPPHASDHLQGRQAVRDAYLNASGWHPQSLRAAGKT